MHSFIRLSKESSIAAVSSPIVALLWPLTLGFVVFQTVLFFIQQNLKYNVLHIQAYLPRLDIAVRPNGKFGRVWTTFRWRFNLHDHWCDRHYCVLCSRSYLLRVHPL
jgi:hypothetical protein